MAKEFRYVVQQFRVPLEEKENIEKFFLTKAGVPEGALLQFQITRLSMDSRKGRVPHWSMNARVILNQPVRSRLMRPDFPGKNPPKPKKNFPQEPSLKNMPEEVHVVGAGPAGMWAALSLLRKGYHVILHEQGNPVETRFKDIRRFVKGGVLNVRSNVLYGEGGAGAFSDGKLTSRSRNAFTDQVLNDIAAAGGGDEVKYLARPHVGTDKLQFIVRQIREWILELGGEIRFDSKLEDVKLSKNSSDDAKQYTLTEACFNTEWEKVDALVIAVGHSARDVYRIFHKHGIAMEAKSFAIGARVEHPQDLINARQLGPGLDYKLTGAAEYVLSCPSKEDVPGGYSFCMCPGGVLVPCASEEGTVATNGMSYSRRNGPFANSGIVVPVDFTDSEDMLEGMKQQHTLEARAFEMGGGDYGAPAQTIQSFLDGKVDRDLPKSSFPRDLIPTDLHTLFDESLSKSLRNSLENFDRKIPGFIKNGLLVAPETRTSSPLRMLRDDRTLESINTSGIFPLGEGAGYSGGIVSSAADGVRLASQVPGRKA